MNNVRGHYSTPFIRARIESVIRMITWMCDSDYNHTMHRGLGWNSHELLYFFSRSIECYLIQVDAVKHRQPAIHFSYFFAVKIKHGLPLMYAHGLLVQ